MTSTIPNHPDDLNWRHIGGGYRMALIGYCTVTPSPTGNRWNVYAQIDGDEVLIVRNADATTTMLQIADTNDAIDRGQL